MNERNPSLAMVLRGKLMLRIMFMIMLSLECTVHGVGTSTHNPRDEFESTVHPDERYSIPQNGRLPLWVSPSHYRLSLSVRLENATYEGVVDIVLKAHNETDKIILNMVDIITANESTQVTRLSSGEKLSVINQTYDPAMQFYVITLDGNLIQEEVYELVIRFRGSLNSKLVGFYLSSYKDEQGKDVLVANTQFSPLDARRAFPCFDEPSFKATFDISIERDSDKFSLSNMPLLNTSAVGRNDARLVDRFETTPKMSTYLVGFLVSDFGFKSSDALNGTKFKVWARKGALDQVDYALQVGPQTLLFLEDYFGVPYPLPKLDMAAVPDFKFNGMENWGLIMYREAALLFDPRASTVASKRNVVRVLGHEIAHMWFGNLVTPRWWSELWLKEGFANFMGYLAVDNVEPSWKMMDYLVESSYSAAFALDSFESSHALNVEVSRPDRISEIFDAISYSKGASIIRMMFHFLSEDVYKRGMQDYLNNLQYSNAVQEDLWYFLTESWKSHQNFDPERTVEVVMNSWTLQEGFPVVHVKRNGSQAYLTQERFLMRGKSTATQTSDDSSTTAESSDSPKWKWWVPVSLILETSPDFQFTEPKVWMSPRDEEVLLGELPTNEGWFLLNSQKTGFFRINYDPSTWALLSNQLMTNHTVIHHLNRVQLLDDAFNLARAGYLNYSVALEMGLYMKSEMDSTTWNTFASNYEYIYNMAATSPNITLLNSYMLDLIIPLYNETGFKYFLNESYSFQGMQILATYWACQVQYEPCLENAQLLFNQWLQLSPEESSDLISNNVKPIILCNGVKNASAEVWNATYQVYLNSNSQAEKSDILKALGCTEDPALIERLLDMSLNTSSGIKKQDAFYVFTGVSTSSTGRALAWKTIKEKWRSILNYFGSGSNSLWRVIEAPTKYFNTRELLEEFEKFRETQKDYLGSAKQTVDRYLEEAEINVNWMAKRFPTVLKWLSTN